MTLPGDVAGGGGGGGGGGIVLEVLLVALGGMVLGQARACSFIVEVVPQSLGLGSVRGMTLEWRRFVNGLFRFLE